MEVPAAAVLPSSGHQTAVQLFDSKTIRIYSINSRKDGRQDVREETLLVLCFHGNQPSGTVFQKGKAGILNVLCVGGISRQGGRAERERGGKMEKKEKEDERERVKSFLQKRIFGPFYREYIISKH